MDLKKSSITADILNILQDGKVHTMNEIADAVEVSRCTVQRHIQSLSYRYPIETFCGGEKRGGVYLDKSAMHQGYMHSDSELQFIVRGLKLLQEQQPENQEIAKLIMQYTPTTQKEISE